MYPAGHKPDARDTVGDVGLLLHEITADMLQLPMETSLKVTIDLACPECNTYRVILQLLTSYGSYCRCENCGHLWHQDRPFESRHEATDATL